MSRLQMVGWGEDCYWHLVGRGWDAALASYNVQDSPLSKELSSTKCEWCEIEKLSFSKKETFVQE